MREKIYILDRGELWDFLMIFLILLQKELKR